MTKDSDYVQLTLSKGDVKPGAVLYGVIAALPQLSAGRVLTSDDVKLIQSSVPVETVTIVTSRKNPDYAEFIPEVAAEMPAWKRNKAAEQRLKDLQLSEAERSLGLTDEVYNQRIEMIVDAKKDIIRGENYEERKSLYFSEQEEKLRQFLLKGQTQQHQMAMESIAHSAEALADFESLQSLESVSPREMALRLVDYEKKVRYFQENVLSTKQIFSSYVKEIVIDVVNDTGYQLQMALYSLISRVYKHFDYFAAHSLQVMMVALVTAIEMTRIVNEKMNKVDEQDDLKSYLSFSRKSFTLEELVDLGIAALLHDIDLKKSVPGMDAAYQPTIHDETCIELHASNGFHLVKKLNLDFDVQRTVYQHHERSDGSGFPSGIQPRLFTKYTPVLMLAEYYVESTTPGPFYDFQATPRTVITRILTQQRDAFDKDFVFALVRATSLFPVGTWVILSNNRLGVVRKTNRGDLKKPVVLVCFDNEMKRIGPFEVNLLHEKEIEIRKTVPTHLVFSKLRGQPLDFIF